MKPRAPGSFVASFPGQKGTGTPLPNAPQNLTVGAVTTSSVALSWSVPSGGATSYNVYRNFARVAAGIAGLSFTDTGLSASTAYTYYVTSVNAFGEGSRSNTVVGTTATPASSGSIVFAPGHYVRTGTNGNSNTPIPAQAPLTALQTCLAYMDAAIADDINNKIKGFVYPLLWASGESPAGGVYDGSWDSSGNSGFALFQALITHAKAYNPPRSVSFTLNCTGNGLNNAVRSSWPTSFAPAYLDSPTYSNGVAYNGDGTSYTGQPTVKFWKAAVAARIVALVQAYYNHFGPDTASGGIYMFDPFNEISVDPNTGYTTTEFLATLTSTLTPGPTSGLRGAAPKWMMFFRPTFLQAGTNNQQYQTLFNLMQASFISMGEEDSTVKVAVSGATLTTAQQNAHDNWGSLAYQGISTFNGGTQQSWPNHVTAGDWTFVCNVEDAELGRNVNTTAVPPATQGSGYLYNSQTFPGIMNGPNTVGASHVIWYLDCPTAGPNVNRGPKTAVAGAPANPTGGPAAGGNATRPNLVDVITGNTTYAGITGPIPIPNTTYPPSWPTSSVNDGTRLTIRGSGFGATMPSIVFSKAQLNATAVGNTPDFGNNHQNAGGTGINWFRFASASVVAKDPIRGNVISFVASGDNTESCKELNLAAAVGLNQVVALFRWSRYSADADLTTGFDPQIKFDRFQIGTSNVSATATGQTYTHRNIDHTTGQVNHMVDCSELRTGGPPWSPVGTETWYLGNNTSLAPINGTWCRIERIFITPTAQGQTTPNGQMFYRAIQGTTVPNFVTSTGALQGFDLKTQVGLCPETDRPSADMIQDFCGNGMKNPNFAHNDWAGIVYPVGAPPLVVEIWNSTTASSAYLREFQLPDSWSDTAIDFTVNIGGLPAGTYTVVVRHVYTDAVVASQPITLSGH